MTPRAILIAAARRAVAALDPDPDSPGGRAGSGDGLAAGVLALACFVLPILIGEVIR